MLYNLLWRLAYLSRLVVKGRPATDHDAERGYLWSRRHD